jgi:hypothetical protein
VVFPAALVARLPLLVQSGESGPVQDQASTDVATSVFSELLRRLEKVNWRQAVDLLHEMEVDGSEHKQTSAKDKALDAIEESPAANQINDLPQDDAQPRDEPRANLIGAAVGLVLLGLGKPRHKRDDLPANSKGKRKAKERAE